MQTYAHVQAEGLKRAAGFMDRIGVEANADEDANPERPTAG